MATPLAQVETPTITPAVGGLLAVANVIPTTDPHFMSGVDYEQVPCGIPAFAPGLCFPDTRIGVDEEEAKQFDSTPGYRTGTPFAIYAGIECYLSERDDFPRLALQAITLGETVAVERAVQLSILNGEDTEVIPGVHSPLMAVALLEQYAASRYGGVPTFHLNRFGTTLLIDKGVFKGDSDGRVTTQQGSLVANGAGYTGTGPNDTATPPAPIEATDTQFWLYATGQVNIWSGPVIANEATAQETNRARAIAERTYVATAECFSVAILVDTTGGTP